MNQMKGQFTGLWTQKCGTEKSTFASYLQAYFQEEYLRISNSKSADRAYMIKD